IPAAFAAKAATKTTPTSPCSVCSAPGSFWKDGTRQPQPVAGIIGRSGRSIDILAPFALGPRIRFLKSWWSAGLLCVRSRRNSDQQRWCSFGPLVPLPTDDDRWHSVLEPWQDPLSLRVLS